MYTSGTTGTPKGIQFSHRNLVFKRFARALALPEIGENDVFLCFLPLFHTFGRYLEMLGCVFWGATYCFLENPSLEALVRGMQRHRPTRLHQRAQALDPAARDDHAQGRSRCDASDERAAGARRSRSPAGGCAGASPPRATSTRTSSASSSNRASNCAAASA